MYRWKISNKTEKILRGEILNEPMIIGVDDYQSQRENDTGYFLSNSIKLVSVCDHLDCSTNERVGNSNLVMNTGTEF